MRLLAATAEETSAKGASRQLRQRPRGLPAAAIISQAEGTAGMEPLETTRICEKCGTPRRIVAMSESATGLAGKTTWFHYGGSAQCKCPDTELNDLDRKAIEGAEGE